MSTLIETAEWEDGIYQLEEDDLVKGGAEGIDNLQAKQLANRTLYLKAMAEALGNEKQPLDATLTAIAALVGVADRIAYFTGNDTFALATFTAFARTLVAAGDAAAARVVLGAASPADIADAVAALVNSSPAALDTLNEFAAALGNDANFAATITNALALKAALASPIFTGDPRGPTPAQFDATTKLATMEALQRALGNFRNAFSLSSATVLNAVHVGAFITAAGGSPFTLTLPAASSLPLGATIVVWNAGADVSVAGNGGDTIALNGSGGASSVTFGNGEFISFTARAGNQWAGYGSGQLKYTASFAASLLTNGYRKLPSGDIEQWGFVNCPAANTDYTFTWPTAFPNAVFVANATPASGATMGYAGITSGPSTTSVTVRASVAGATVYITGKGK